MDSKDRFNITPKAKKVKKNLLPLNPEMEQASGRFPKWLHRKLPSSKEFWETKKILTTHNLPTVCEEAKCPNRLECYSKKTATFLTLGKDCTRSCGFCDIDFSKTPAPVDPSEPERTAESVSLLGLKHVVLTMVARDDLEDGGALHLAQIIKAIKIKNPSVTLEVLTSDLEGKESSLDILLSEGFEIFNHNIETVREKSSSVRHKATYERSLNVLRYIKQKAPSLYVKSGIMVGLGETKEQVIQALHDLKNANVDIVTIGQYLQANRNKLRVKEFITPEQFKEYEEIGHKIGIPHMYCGPFIRSSYNADKVLENLQMKALV